MGENKRTNNAGGTRPGSPGALRRLITAVVIAAMSVTLIGTSAAKANRSNADTSGVVSANGATGASGMMTGINTVVGAAPAGFRGQMDSFYSRLAADAQKNKALAGNTNLLQDALLSRTLLKSANDRDLAIIHYMMSRISNWQKAPANFEKAARWYSAVKRYQAAGGFKGAFSAKLKSTHMNPSAYFRTHAFDDACPVAESTKYVVLAFSVAYALAKMVYGYFAGSFMLSVLGFGITSPIGWPRAILLVVTDIFALIYYGAKMAYEYRWECRLDAHQTQQDTENTYVRDQTSNMTVDLKVTPVDAYHFMVAAHENGAPIDVLQSSVKIATTRGGTSLKGQTPVQIYSGTSPDPTSGVTFTKVTGSGITDGLYSIYIPPGQVGSAYRLRLSDGAQSDTGGNGNADHFGTAVFTRASV